MLQKGRGRGRLAIGLVLNLEEGNINKMNYYYEGSAGYRHIFYCIFYTFCHYHDVMLNLRHNLPATMEFVIVKPSYFFPLFRCLDSREHEGY